MWMTVRRWRVVVRKTTSGGLAVWRAAGVKGAQAPLTHADVSQTIGGSSLRMTITEKW